MTVTLLGMTTCRITARNANEFAAALNSRAQYSTVTMTVSLSGEPGDMMDMPVGTTEYKLGSFVASVYKDCIVFAGSGGHRSAMSLTGRIIQLLPDRDDQVCIAYGPQEVTFAFRLPSGK